MSVCLKTFTNFRWHLAPPHHKDDRLSSAQTNLFAKTEKEHFLRMFTAVLQPLMRPQLSPSECKPGLFLMLRRPDQTQSLRVWAALQHACATGAEWVQTKYFPSKILDKEDYLWINRSKEMTVLLFDDCARDHMKGAVWALKAHNFVNFNFKSYCIL